jgi:hypothetical protein
MAASKFGKISPHDFAAALRDQPRGALVARVNPQPVAGSNDKAR